jgi:peptidoglycan/xylan/chitin deacetylase (PgdA/CDA1 family)
MLTAKTKTAAAAVSAALALAGCGGGSGGAGSSSSGGVKITPGGGRGATQPPIAHRTVAALVPAAGAPARTVRVPVLTYHRVCSSPCLGQLDLKVESSNFAAELAALHAHGYHTISQAQLFNALYHGAALPTKPVIVSVDDGYKEDVTTILPDLERYRMVATFFIISGRFKGQLFVNEDQVRQLDQAGMDIGAHSVTHLIPLPSASASRLKMEVEGSKHTLEQVVGHPVSVFAYPFGNFDSRVIDEVRSAGFAMAFTTAAGTTESTTAPFAMPRIHVGRALTPTGLLAQLGG